MRFLGPDHAVHDVGPSLCGVEDSPRPCQMGLWAGLAAASSLWAAPKQNRMLSNLNLAKVIWAKTGVKACILPLIARY